ncbi:hypothetical protein [Streptomyces sp. NPDC058674]|uniref:hypothetical protein n=1 Tax=Streptomyces sp. NPDC058674 TaxID=3346592 RepID=UPI0036690CA7
MATATPPATTPDPQPADNSPTKTEKVMAIVIAILCGTIAAFIAFILTRHYQGTALMAAGAFGTSFIGTAGFTAWIEDKLHLL